MITNDHDIQIMTLMPHAIEAKNLSKTFKHRVPFAPFGSRIPPNTTIALREFNLTIKAGEIFALLGPNGAGKTTLLKILSHLVIPDAGVALIYGHSFKTHAMRIKTLVSLLLGEERSFYWRLTGRQNLEFFAALYEIKPKEIALKILQVEKLFELESLDQRYQEYSSGMKQRLALARCFLSQAKLILMDEPTRNLDPNNAEKFRSLIKTYLQERPDHTFFFTTHNTQEAEYLAHRIGILDHGVLQACGSLDELRHLINNPNASLDEIFHNFTRKKS